MHLLADIYIFFGFQCFDKSFLSQMKENSTGVVKKQQVQFF